MEDFGAVWHLGIALALGLLIGAERGWHGRELAGGSGSPASAPSA